MRSSDATIHAHAAAAFGFKKCCLGSGKYDGSLRNHYRR